MKTVSTKIIIQAPAAQVWKSLVNFPAYPSWNPFIQSLEGQAKVGTELEAVICPPGQKPMTFRPTVLRAEKDQEFRWKGKLFVNGIFDGEHYFILRSISENETEFEHGEHFTGLLSGILFKMIGESTKQGFEAMNEALKEEVESTNVL